MPAEDNLMLSKAVAVAATTLEGSNSTFTGAEAVPKMCFPSSNLPVVTQVVNVLNCAVMVPSCKSIVTMSSFTSAKMSEASLGLKSVGKFMSLSTLGCDGCECRDWGWESANEVGESKLGGAPGTVTVASGFINVPLANWTFPSEAMVEE